jgi:hypothetical protein
VCGMRDDACAKCGRKIEGVFGRKA